MNLSTSFQFIENFLGHTPTEIISKGIFVSPSENTDFINVSNHTKNVTSASINMGHMIEAMPSLWLIFLFTGINLFYQKLWKHL